ncbi:thioesterase II family protein [Mycobacterium kyorinense]|uniref:thioesterase II family protein n=1 Tax=Mycobacterium kyorinense TaxID=487514 RepID=UPI000B28AEA6|nr:alpha/beta fold hydrolase [Mycobacterium kyorinense]
MPRTLGWIRQFHKPDSPERPVLLVFPHAGSGASAYRDFSKVLSSTFSVLVFQYPGRQDRAGEAPLLSLPAMAAAAFEEFSRSEHNRDVPIVTFGHSMGALVAFEFVRIAESSGIDVRQLNVSAAVAPSHVAAKPPHPTDDEAILNHLATLEGTETDVFANRELMRLALPVIKADYQPSMPTTARQTSRWRRRFRRWGATRILTSRWATSTGGASTPTPRPSRCSTAGTSTSRITSTRWRRC